MEYATINISNLNDFIFCPYSIYLHNVYQSMSEESYHDLPQVRGKQAHKTVDNGTYSTKADVLTGLSVYSEKYGLFGKIDQFFVKKRRLVERKRCINHIYDGYKMQILAQYFCLIDMGYQVNELVFHSMKDNKNHTIPIPDDDTVAWFEQNLGKIRAYNPLKPLGHVNSNKCDNCIYHALCDQAATEFK